MQFSQRINTLAVEAEKALAPIFARIDVSAANTADPSANQNHIRYSFGDLRLDHLYLEPVRVLDKEALHVSAKDEWSVDVQAALLRGG